MRTLYRIPVYHSSLEVDQEGMRNAIENIGNEMGKDRADAFYMEFREYLDNIVDAYWDKIEWGFWKKRIDVSKVKIFQEGFLRIFLSHITHSSTRPLTGRCGRMIRSPGITAGT